MRCTLKAIVQQSVKLWFAGMCQKLKKFENAFDGKYSRFS